jgi:hypothetical protein
MLSALELRTPNPEWGFTTEAQRTLREEGEKILISGSDAECFGTPNRRNPGKRQTVNGER